jgi:hypothetical protein
VFDTALNFREAYLEYIPNYPIAAYRVEEEKEKNPAFKAFHEVNENFDIEKCLSGLIQECRKRFDILAHSDWAWLIS